VNNILLIGGKLRSTIFRRLEEWQSCEKALIVELDPLAKGSRCCIEYVSPPQVCPPELPGTLFKSATIKGNRLYTCTSTEVLVFELPLFRIEKIISLPFFNDLHHVYPTDNNTLLIAVTGLDMVSEVSMDGTPIREWNVLGQDPWGKFSRKTDYRLVATTKPHASHPNHVFVMGDEVWVTRFQQRDAICLTNQDRRIDIAVERPHDGYIFGDQIYFTTVDGHVVIANRRTLRVERTVNLNEMQGLSGQVLGWCRGVLPLDDRYVWVGFTRVRPTKFVENVAWIKNRNPSRRKASHIALYDLKRSTCEMEVPLEPHGLGIVFSLLPSVS
jgi:hypothetical protein